MVITYEDSLYAVVDNGDGTATVYPLDDVYSHSVPIENFDALAAVKAVADRTLVVGDRTYTINHDGTYCQIKRDGEFFTEADWEGDVSDEDALQMILDELEGDEAESVFPVEAEDPEELAETSEPDPHAAFFANADRIVEVKGERWRLSDCGLTFFATSPTRDVELELEFQDAQDSGYVSDEELQDAIEYELEELSHE